jgi:hypothetical protein
VKGRYARGTHLGLFGGSRREGGSCPTDAFGICSISTSPHKRDSSVTFTVDALIRGNDFYSGGDSITINR